MSVSQKIGSPLYDCGCIDHEFDPDVYIDFSDENFVLPEMTAPDGNARNIDKVRGLVQGGCHRTLLCSHMSTMPEYQESPE